MAAPIDSPDWIAITAAADSPQILDQQLGDVALPYTTALLDTTQWSSLVISAQFGGPTADAVIRIFIEWSEGGVVIGRDVITCWGTPSIASLQAPLFVTLPARATQCTVTFGSVTPNLTARLTVIGSRRVAVAPFLSCNIQASNPTLVSANPVATAINQFVNYRVGPVNQQVQIALTSLTQTHSVVAFLEADVAGAIIETQMAAASAAAGATVTLGPLFAQQNAIRIQVHNTAAAAGTFELVATEI